MKYIRVQWLHSNPDDPVELYSELDDDGWEVRKIELFQDGTVGYSSSTESTEPTRLGETPVPALEEINSQPEFRAQSIEKEQFERVWLLRGQSLRHIERTA